LITDTFEIYIDYIYRQQYILYDVYKYYSIFGWNWQTIFKLKLKKKLNEKLDSILEKKIKKKSNPNIQFDLVIQFKYN
jgi:hypothetical protein